MKLKKNMINKIVHSFVVDSNLVSIHFPPRNWIDHTLNRMIASFSIASKSNQFVAPLFFPVEFDRIAERNWISFVNKSTLVATLLSTKQQEQLIRSSFLTFLPFCQPSHTNTRTHTKVAVVIAVQLWQQWNLVCVWLLRSDSIVLVPHYV